MLNSRSDNTQTFILNGNVCKNVLPKETTPDTGMSNKLDCLSHRRPFMNTLLTLLQTLIKSRDMKIHLQQKEIIVSQLIIL